MEHPELIHCNRTRRTPEWLRFVVGVIIGMAVALMWSNLAARASEMPNIIYDYMLKKYVVEVEREEEIELPEQTEVVSNPYQTLSISDAEFEELRWIIALEAQGEGLQGEIAVCEAIFNRCLSANNWGYAKGGLHGVLSKRGQFATYKYIGSSRAWAVPGELEDDAISETLRNGLTVLPSYRYVYFDSRGGVNGRNRFRMKNHTFGEE